MRKTFLLASRLNSALRTSKILKDNFSELSFFLAGIVGVIGKI